VSHPSASELTGRLPGAVVERFQRDLNRVWAGAAESGVESARFVIAVSGGPDSMALLALAAVSCSGRIVAVTVDHELRPESRAEAAMVADACAALSVPHATLTPGRPIAGSSLQARAREARYAAIEAWAAKQGLALVLTAHHADDQAETLLMRLNRASGLAGLAGIRASQPMGDMVLLRPVLDWRRSELRAVVEAAGLPWVEDPSNMDSRHDRSRIRALLGGAPELDPVRLAASAKYLGDAETVIERLVQRLWDEHWRGPGQPFDVQRELREVRRRLIRRAILATRETLAVTEPPFGAGANVEPLLDALEAGSAAVQGGVKVDAVGGGWVFTAAPPRRPL
jgi:tRNA(Ile)-lysidine synthase